jgi:hypothetical protein
MVKAAEKSNQHAILIIAACKKIFKDLKSIL